MKKITNIKTVNLVVIFIFLAYENIYTLLKLKLKKKKKTLQNLIKKKIQNIRLYDK